MTTDAPEEYRPVGTMGYSPEGGGTVATCHRCGWLTWREDKHIARAAGDAHTCPKVRRKKGR